MDALGELYYTILLCVCVCVCIREYRGQDRTGHTWIERVGNAEDDRPKPGRLLLLEEDEVAGGHRSHLFFSSFSFWFLCVLSLTLRLDFELL